MNSIANYWSIVEPAFRFLKENLQSYKIDDVKNIIGKKIDRKYFDLYILNDSRALLRLSIINLLAYKLLACGKYLAWARTTVYFSQFYIINCLLRLKGFALVHPYYFNKGILSLKINKVKNEPKYRIEEYGRKGHQIIMKRFSELYPDLISKAVGTYTIQERIDWNYDLSYASQTTDDHALEEADDRCKHNFLDPNFGISYSAEHAEYLGGLISGPGVDEGVCGQYIKYATELFSEIAKVSHYRDWYVQLFERILYDIDVIQSKQETKDEIKKWFADALSQI